MKTHRSLSLDISLDKAISRQAELELRNFSNMIEIMANYYLTNKQQDENNPANTSTNPEYITTRANRNGVLPK